MNRLRDRLLLMGGEVELALQRSLYALIKRDSPTVGRVLEHDRVIKRLKIEIDQLGIEVLAVQRPVEDDLRIAIAIIKLMPILDRIADHAVSIARTALLLNDEPELRCYGKLDEMAGITLVMLQTALDTFTESDSGKARLLIAKDEEVDRLYNNLVQEWMRTMSQDASQSARLARFLFVAKHLERIGDYVKNICELTVYMKEAVFIKHM
ncbi:MAG: phosphate signaling complex protein PhoU [Pyrinomonadaceae bacterium]